MSLAAVEFDYLRALVKDHTAIVLDAGKEYLAETRLAPLLGEQNCRSVQELLITVAAATIQWLCIGRCSNAMTNNETWFFRDANCFAALTGTILPEMMKTARGANASSRSGARPASSGQEPYSIAMALREQFNLPGWSFSILGTDFCTAILERAAAGLYRQMEVNRGLPTKSVDPLFQAAGSALAIAAGNSLDGAGCSSSIWPEPWSDIVPPADIVFLRNVLIYFDVETRKAILARVRRVLRPDGFLFLGCAETTLNLDAGFQTVQAGNYVCYKLKDR